MPLISSILVAQRLEVLSADLVERLHAATLRLLEQVGVGLTTGAPSLAPGHRAQANDLPARLTAAGAGVGGDRIRLPAAVVQEALARCPREILFAARDPDLDLQIDGTRAYLSLDGCAAEILPPGAEAPRPSTLADVAVVTRIADALEEIAFVWQPVAARDVAQDVASLHELRAQLGATRKHVQMMTATTPPAAGGVVEMARAVAGGDAELRRRPLLSAFQCSVSPMSYEPGALQAAAIMAEAGIPCGFVVMPIAGASAPITPWGALLQTNAEVLAGIVILQLLVPGAPTFYGACTTVMDLRTGAAACGGPEDLFFQAAVAQLARHYGLPASVGTFATGSRRSDWQAGLENGLSGAAALLAGASMLSGAGLLEGARVFSPEQMVLDAESFRLLAAMFDLGAAGRAGGDVRAGKIGGCDDFGEIVELVAEVGPGGHYLDRDHTVAHMDVLWRPRLFTREGREAWEEAGCPDPRRRARQRIDELLAEQVPPTLDDDLAVELDRIVAGAERRAGVATGAR